MADVTDIRDAVRERYAEVIHGGDGAAEERGDQVDEALRTDAGGVVDVHLMIADPERQIPEFAAAGADSITFHAEATPHANRLLHAIRERNVRGTDGSEVDDDVRSRGQHDPTLAVLPRPVNRPRAGRSA